ncbi:enoyl-CoA hydratase [Bradyrhizobium sp. LB7.1]
MNAPTTANEDLLYSVTDGIARITFNRPQARNALTFAMYERMAEICLEINADRSIKALILTGAGDKAFASGTDISQFRAFKTAQDALDYEARIDRVLGTLEQCRVPVIAAIAGACTGGGAGIAACCDLRIGTEATRIGFPIARTLGNCLSMSNISRVVSLVGPARTKDMIFKARLVEAPEALALGLLTEIVPDVETLQRRADETAKLVASHAPLTLEATKEAVRRIRRTLSRGRGRGSDPQGLYERRFPRGNGRLPQQAHAQLEGQVAYLRLGLRQPKVIGGGMPACLNSLALVRTMRR